MVNETSNIIIKICSDGKYKWYQVDLKGDVLDQKICQSLAELPPQRRKQQTVVLLPGRECLMTTVTMPKTNRNNLQKALPFVIEDQVAGNVEDLHIVVNPIPGSSEYLVAAINRQYFESIYHELQQHNIHPKAILADFLALDFSPSVWTIKLDDEMALVRVSREMGYSIALDHLTLGLSLKAKQLSLEKPIRCQVTATCGMHDISRIADNAEDFLLQTHHHAKEFDPELFSAKPVMNLAQGEFRCKKPAKSGGRNPWRYVAYATLVFLLLLFVNKAIWWFELNKKNQALNDKISTLYQQIMGKGAIENEGRQKITALLQHKMRGQRQDPMIRTLVTVGQTLAKFPSLELKSISFQTGQLTLQVSADKLSALESFSRQLEQADMKILQNQVSTGETVVTDTLVVRAKS